MNDLRGTPMAVGSLEEIIDDQHAIVSTVSCNEWIFPVLWCSVPCYHLSGT